MLQNISPAASELGDLGGLNRVTFLLEMAKVELRAAAKLGRALTRTTAGDLSRFELDLVRVMQAAFG